MNFFSFRRNTRAFNINKNVDLSDQNCSLKWIAEQRENMKVCYKYGLDVIAFVQKCGSKGPTNEKFPESPVISFVNSLRETNEEDKVSVVKKKQRREKVLYLLKGLGGEYKICDSL